MDGRLSDNVQSIMAGASDIQRWVLQIALKGSCSQDRAGDIEAAAARIAQLATKMADHDRNP